MIKVSRMNLPFLLCCLIAITLLAMPDPAIAKYKHHDKTPDWCFVEPEEEIPSDKYDSMLYSEIAPRLCEIQKTSDRVSVEVIGQSAGGRDMLPGNDYRALQ
jgi:hypothetical protein